MGQPTSVNNVETFAAACHISPERSESGIVRSVQKNQQVQNSFQYQVTVRKPGVYELPWGTKDIRTS
jgi:NADH:ubiquinone oxidoreductase subunit F (NADH-binding)